MKMNLPSGSSRYRAVKAAIARDALLTILAAALILIILSPLISTRHTETEETSENAYSEYMDKKKRRPPFIRTACLAGKLTCRGSFFWEILSSEATPRYYCPILSAS